MFYTGKVFHRESTYKHLAPVWKVHWVVKEVSLTEGCYSECLITIGMDGNILQWSIQKGFESFQIMQLKRMGAKNKQEKKAKSKGRQQHGSKKAKQLARRSGNRQNKESEEKPLRMHIRQGYITQHSPGMGIAFSSKDPNM